MDSTLSLYKTGADLSSAKYSDFAQSSSLDSRDSEGKTCLFLCFCRWILEIWDH